MNFSSDAMADFEGLLEVNRKICKQQMAEKASPTLPTNCAVLPLTTKNPNHISDKKHDSDNSVQQIKPNPYQKRLLP